MYLTNVHTDKPPNSTQAQIRAHFERVPENYGHRPYTKPNSNIIILNECCQKEGELLRTVSDPISVYMCYNKTNYFIGKYL